MMRIACEKRVCLGLGMAGMCADGEVDAKFGLTLGLDELCGGGEILYILVMGEEGLISKEMSLILLMADQSIACGSSAQSWNQSSRRPVSLK
jgi:hypothetical protein